MAKPLVDDELWRLAKPLFPLPGSPLTSSPAPLLPSEPLASSHVPTPLASLVGREQEIQEVRRYLLRDDVRLLTLVGPPGIGKTRLSIAAAASMMGAFKDGVHFVALETIDDPNLVTAAIADSLGVKSVGTEPIPVLVARCLCDKQVLLVLDNFEQVLDAGLYVLQLLSDCPALKVLATSREALRVYGEWRYAVPPLDLPDRDRLSELGLDGLRGVDSVVLFTRHAQAVKPDFALTPTNVSAVAAICTRLDGLPLAIELAATRTALFSPDQILTGLGSRLTLLKGNLRYLPSRQRTLRGAIDWSYHLLDPSERTLFRRMGVFAGGSTRAAAEAVCPARDSYSANRSSFLDCQVEEGLASLVDKSLLQFQSAEVTEANSEGRYVMLEMLREYASERLRASGEEQEARRRHAEYYLQFAEAAAARLSGPEQARWLQTLEEENANLRAALAWSVEGEPETAASALRLCGALARFWDMRGYASEGRHWLELALAQAAASANEDGDSDQIPSAVRIKALMAAGNLAHLQSDYGAARSLYQVALALCRETGHKVGIATAFLNLGNVANHLAEYAEARALHEHALTLYRELGDKPAIAQTLLNMGVGARNTGDHALAESLYVESLALRRELGNQYGTALVLGNLGELAFEQGHMLRAHALLEESLSLRRDIGDERGVAYCLMWLANLACAEQAFEAGSAKYKEALVLYHKVGDTEGVAACLEWLAEAIVKRGLLEQGVQLWGAADAIRQALGTPLPLARRASYQQAVARARAKWGEVETARAWAQGRAMTLEQSLACALAATR